MFKIDITTSHSQFQGIGASNTYTRPSIDKVLSLIQSYVEVNPQHDIDHISITRIES